MIRRNLLTPTFILATSLFGCGSQATHTAGEVAPVGALPAGQGGPAAFVALKEVTLHPQSDTDLCLSAASESYQAGAPITLAACDGGKNQRFFRFGKQLRIFDDKCVHVDGGADADGTAIVVGECEGAGTEAAFDFIDEGFRWAGSVRCLDVTGGQFAAGTPLQIWSCVDHSPNQAFGFLPVGASDDGKGSKVADNKGSTTPTNVPAVPGSSVDKKATPDTKPSPAKGSDKKAEPAKVEPAKVDVPAKPTSEQNKDKAPSKGSKDSKDSKAKPAPSADAKPAAADKSAGKEPVKLAANGTFGPAPAGVLVAPYFYDWGSPTGFAKTLVDVRNKAGLKAATIAFGLSGGGCKVAGFGDIGADIKAFRKAGGQVVLSFGGAAGTYLQATCQNSTNLAKAILAEMAAYDTHFIDFDIEGADKNVNRVTDPASNQALMAALVDIQKQDAQASISLTLAADDNGGVSGDSFKLLQLAASKGVKLARVNIMAMDYGHKPAAGKTTADMAIAAAEKTAAQMAKVWPKASQAEIFHAIGITPMIGQNDGDTDAPFLPSDASKVAAYAKAKGIGLLAYWAMQRDLAAKGDYNDHSNNQSSDFQYFKAFSSAQ